MTAARTRRAWARAAALGVQSLCIAGCIDEAPCAAIDGADADAALVLAECYAECV